MWLLFIIVYSRAENRIYHSSYLVNICGMKWVNEYFFFFQDNTLFTPYFFYLLWNTSSCFKWFTLSGLFSKTSYLQVMRLSCIRHSFSCFAGIISKHAIMPKLLMVLAVQNIVSEVWLQSSQSEPCDWLISNVCYRTRGEHRSRITDLEHPIKTKTFFGEKKCILLLTL